VRNNHQPRILYPAKLSFNIDRVLKTWYHKDKLIDFMLTKPTLEKILNGIFHTEEEEKQSQK
jgi:hypothetical protein